MALRLTGKIVGIERVEADFRSAPDRMKARLREAIHKQGVQLQGLVAGPYLHGPRPQRLGVVTGRLTRSINYRYTEAGDSLTGSVGTNVKYGAFWELGFMRNDDRKAHVRALGKPKRATKKYGRRQRIAYVKASQGSGPRFQEPRRFLSPALAERRAEIITALTTAAKGAP